MKILSKVNKNINSIKKNKTKIIILILTLSVIFIIAWLNRSKLSAENVTNWLEGRFLSIGLGEGYPCGIFGDDIEPSNFSLIDNNIVVLSNTSLTVLNDTAKQMANRPHNLSKPMMKTNEGRAILYDMGGKKYSIDTISRNIRAGVCENGIISGAISENGVYGLVTESKDYLSEMIIYGNDGVEKYRYYFSEYYISDISINKKGTNATVCGITSDDGGLKSIVYVFDFKSDTPIMTFEYEQNMIMSVEYLDNGNIVAIGDKSTSVVNTWTDTKQDFDYEKKILTCFDVNKYEGIALSLSSVEGGQNCEVILLDRSGNIVVKIPTEYTVISLASRGTRIAGVSEESVFAYKISGEFEGSWIVTNNIRKLQLRSATSGYVLGVNKIYKLHLK